MAIVYSILLNLNFEDVFTDRPSCRETTKTMGFYQTNTKTVTLCLQKIR